MVNRKSTHLTAADRKMRLLITEDDRESADYLVKAFREVGHIADLATDGEEGLALAESGDYDVLVVDRMLPKRDGLSLIGALREKGNRTPVLILSALGQVDDRIKGLRAGGDDYLPKPYSFAELLARIEVLSRRRGGPAEETAYRVGDLELDRLSHRVARGKDELTLQPREFRLLEYLMKHAGQVVTRTMLLENVWDYHFDPQTNVIDVHISRLRSKIDKGFERPLLHTIRGAGYMIRDGLQEADPNHSVPVDAGLSVSIRAVRGVPAWLFCLEHTASDHRTDHRHGECGNRRDQRYFRSARPARSGSHHRKSRAASRRQSLSGDNA